MRYRRLRLLWLVSLATLAAGVLGCQGNDGSSEVHEVTIAQLQTMLTDGNPLILVDVRTPAEFAAGHIEGALNRPVDEIETWAAEFEPSARIAVICQVGGRSRRAASVLVAKGFTQVYNVTEGMAAWPGPVVRGAS